MDKYEYKVRSEEISKLIDKERYAEAVKIADTIDWRRVKSAAMLLKIAALYRISRRNEDSREMLMLAYERYPTNRSVVYSLCELSIELDDVVAAIEYYKHFAKLAPKDNGVYTLRYRILEAQEASLEERIEILEELKKKDYQEEWAYELAYLYHRVGLSTKCVEECDDIILWFGDGPYVMKAMELKAKHVPLTELQQQNYDIMLGNAGQNYSSGNYDTENYGSDDYNVESYDTQDYNVEGYDEQNDYTEGYGGQNYDAESYDGQNYDAEVDYDAQNYNSENYDAGSYDAQGYEVVNNQGQDFGEGAFGIADDLDGSYGNETYGNETYGQEAYADEQYANESYGNEGYVDEGYGQVNYSGGQYADEAYGQENYSNGQYTDDGYGHNSYVDDGYGNLSYTDGAYQDNGYTGEFYVEQTYDENGNLIEPEMYTDSGYPQDEHLQDDSHAGQTDQSMGYRNGLHLVENTSTPAGNSGDMSQYNTINLQKVVAESMKELFPDDNDDVFAEDREKYNAGETVRDRLGDTRIFAGVTDQGIAKDQSDDQMEASGNSAGFQTTGRVNIAQMVTGVSEKAPEPHTGAIKKVFVPGDDARSIKSDSNMEELRDTTEKSVDDEHTRMEYNDENVYHEQSLIETNETDETMQDQATGSMNLDDVLVEWERMKQDNARKHQEEIKKRVLTQTGKIFANFDNSIKSGILGELEREEEEAKNNTQTGSLSRQGNAVEKSNDGFLDADVTSDIPQQPKSEDDFDVEYVADHEQPSKLQEPGNEVESGKDELDVGGDISTEFGHAVLQKPDELGEKESAKDTYTEKAVGSVQGLSTESLTDIASGGEGASEAEDRETDPYAQEMSKIDVYEQEIKEDTADCEADTYTQKISTESNSYAKGDHTEDEYIGETYAQDAGGYTGEIYEEDVDGYAGGTYGQESSDTYVEGVDEYNGDAGEYTGEVYAGDAGQYTEELYTGDAGYTGEVYAGDAGQYTEELYTGDAGYTGEVYAGDAGQYTEELYAGDAGQYTEELYARDAAYTDGEPYLQREEYDPYVEDSYDDLEDAYSESSDVSGHLERRRNDQYNERELDPEDAESIAEMAKEDALKTQEIKMNTADLSSLSEKIVATTKKEASGAKREEIRDFTPEEQTLFENFAVTKKIKKQIIHALENMTLAAYTGNVIITGDAGLDTVRMAKNLIKEYQASDEYFSGKLAKISGEKINQRNIKDVFEKLNNGGIIIEKANGMSEEKLYELAINLNQDTLGIVVIMEDTKKEITKLLEKQAMIVDYFNIRIDLMEMDNNALVAYAKNYALALEYSIDELGTLALYTRIANMQSGNHVVTKDEVRDIIDEAIWKSKKSKIKNFVDVLFARRYDNEDMIVLKERDFM